MNDTFVTLASMKRQRGRPPHQDVLTPAEWSVLRYIRGGLSYKQIAQGLRISRDAVKQHSSNIRGKLGFASREELTLWKGRPSQALKRRNGEANSMPVQKIDTLINVSDVQRSLSFYRDQVGMTLGQTWADEGGRTRWARLISMGESSLMLNEPFGEGLTGRDARPSYRDVVVYLHVSGLDELHAIHTKLTKAGAAPSECRDEMYGQREFTVRDPDGYEIAFATPLG